MKKQNGFTLIEVLVYIALFGIMMLGIVGVTYAILESTGKGQSRIVMQEEGDFLMGKINWALTGATTTVVTASTLSVTKNNFPSNPLFFDTAPGKLRLTQGIGLPTNLNSDAVSVSMVFINIPAQGNRPEGVTASATLTTITPTGASISQHFETTKYVRR